MTTNGFHWHRDITSSNMHSGGAASPTDSSAAATSSSAGADTHRRSVAAIGLIRAGPRSSAADPQRGRAGGGAMI